MGDIEIFKKLGDIINARNKAFNDKGIKGFIYKDQIRWNELNIIAPNMQWDEFEKFCDQYHKDENSKIQDILSKHSYYKDNNVSDYSAEYTAHYFLREVKRTNDLEESLKNLKRCLNREPTALQNVLIIAGVECTETIQLDEHIKICSLDDLTWSCQKESFLKSIDPSEDPFLGIHSSSGLVLHGFKIREMKRCAIVYERPHYPIIPLEKSTQCDFYTRDQQTFLELVSFIKFLVTIEGVAPYIETNWQQTNEENLNRWRLNWGVVGDNFEFQQFIPKRFFSKFTMNKKIVIDLYNQVQALDAQLKQKLLLALGHIMIARYYQYEDEQILNIAIALEVLLLNRNEGGKTRNLSLRAALILKETVADRESVQEDFKKFYGYRSDLVHGGHLKLKKDGSIDIDPEIIKRVISNTGKIVQKIIENNKIPNWQDIELSQQNIWY